MTSPTDKQLRIAIEKLIYIFKSSLFQALLDIQGFYEEILLDNNKDANSKALAVLRIAEKWQENNPLPSVQVGSGNYAGSSNSNNAAAAVSMNDLLMPLPRKSPGGSYRSENMSLDGPVNTQDVPMNGSSPQKNDNDQNDDVVDLPNYSDHWTFENIVLERSPGVSLGFSIAGGTDNPMYGNNTAIFITKLTPNGLSERDGRLRPNDILYKVNDVVLDDVDHNEAVQALKNAGNTVYLTVKRLQPTLVEEITLEKSQNGLGFSISGGLFTEHLKNDHGIFVTKIIPGGAADLDGKLCVGDRILSVNDVSLEYVTHDDAVEAISSIVEQFNEIVIRVAKVTQYSQTDSSILRLVFYVLYYLT